MQEAYSGNIQTDRQSKWGWPRQSKVTKSQKRLWGEALRTHLLKSLIPRIDGTINYDLKDALGKWINATNQSWRYYYDPKSHILLKMTGEKIKGMHLQSTRRKWGEISFDSELLTANPMNGVLWFLPVYGKMMIYSMTRLVYYRKIWRLHIEPQTPPTQSTSGH